MICGIMQPYFFPYLGYFDLISRCDTWVVFDIAQYTPRSWMTRNRVLHPSKDWMYVGCEVHGSQNMKISDVMLKDPAASQKKMLGHLTHYKKRAPYYKAVVNLVQRSFDNLKSNALTEMNVSALQSVCQYLDIPFAPIVASEAQFDLPKVAHPGQWALEISTALGADEYLNPPGGKEIFRPQEFAERGIRLGFTNVPQFSYGCRGFEFVPSLSILDVLMWNAPEDVRAALGRDAIEYAA